MNTLSCSVSVWGHILPICLQSVQYFVILIVHTAKLLGLVEERIVFGCTDLRTSEFHK